MTEIQNSGADDIKAQAENPPEEKIKKLNRDQLNENNDYNKRDRSRDPESKKKKKKDKDSKKKKKRRFNIFLFLFFSFFYFHLPYFSKQSCDFLKICRLLH